MRAERSNGLNSAKRWVTVTVCSEDRNEEVQLFRGGRLGLASRSPIARSIRSYGGQLQSPPVTKK